jgi:pantetheine-phosphate adenylyltransferase
MRRGIFPGTFDPVTEGHLDILRRSLKVLDEVTVAVARAYHKDTLFTLEERQELLRGAVDSIPGARIEVMEGLLVDFARERGAAAIVRGLRFVSDFEYELQLALMNYRLAPQVETLFFMPSAEYSYLNSSVIKEVARLGGDVSGLVPAPVLDALRKKYNR